MTLPRPAEVRFKPSAKKPYSMRSTEPGCPVQVLPFSSVGAHGQLRLQRGPGEGVILTVPMASLAKTYGA